MLGNPLQAAPLAAEMFAGFVDDHGAPVTQATLQRPYRLVVFGYTTCPDVCPLTLQAVHRALVRLGHAADTVDPVFVTVDPDRDTAERLNQYVSAFDDRIRGYRGDDADLKRLAQALKVSYWREAVSLEAKDYSMSHTATLFLLARDGRVVFRIEHTDDPTRLASAITKAVNSAIDQRL